MEFAQHLQHELEAAYRRGYQDGAAGRLNRHPLPPTHSTVKISLSSVSSTALDNLAVPRSIAFDISGGAPIREVLVEIQRRLPELPYPFTVTTVAGAKKLVENDMVPVCSLLNGVNATTVLLRLNVQLPSDNEQRKGGMGSRLRSAFGRSASRQRDGSEDEGGQGQAGGEVRRDSRTQWGGAAEQPNELHGHGPVDLGNEGQNTTELQGHSLVEVASEGSVDRGRRSTVDDAAPPSYEDAIRARS